MNTEANKNKKILILGGEGFIGRNISQVLADQYECYSVGTEKSIFPEREDMFISGDPYAEKMSGDYDAYIHLIDSGLEGPDFRDAELKLAKNIGMKAGAHLIIFSSAAIYADPDSDYAKRKKMFEEFYSDYCGSDYCGKNGLNLTICRLFNVFGEYQLPNRQGSLVANIFCNHLNGKLIGINDFEAKRDMIYARDMARMIEYIIRNNCFGPIEIGSGRLISMRELVGTIEEKIIKGKLNIKDNGLKEKAISPAAKNELLEKIELLPLKKGLSKTFEFYKNNLAKINKYLSL